MTVEGDALDTTLNGGNGTPATYNVAADTDGVLKINDVRYVLESDLLANKGANDTRISELTTAHKTELDQHLGNQDSNRTLMLQAQAESERLRTEVQGNSTLKADLEKANADLATAQTSNDTNMQLAMHYRKELMVTSYGIKPEQLEGKSMHELASFEEALKAVKALNPATDGLAVGGTPSGVPQVTPDTPQQRMQKVVDSAETKFQVKAT